LAFGTCRDSTPKGELLFLSEAASPVRVTLVCQAGWVHDLPTVRAHENEGRIDAEDRRILQGKDRPHCIKSMLLDSLLQELKCAVNMSAVALNTAATEGSDVLDS
jgi:hypothetical protein